MRRQKDEWTKIMWKNEWDNPLKSRLNVTDEAKTQKSDGEVERWRREWNPVGDVKADGQRLTSTLQVWLRLVYLSRSGSHDRLNDEWVRKHKFTGRQHCSRNHLLRSSPLTDRRPLLAVYVTSLSTRGIRAQLVAPSQGERRLCCRWTEGTCLMCGLPRLDRGAEKARTPQPLTDADVSDGWHRQVDVRNAGPPAAPPLLPHAH